MASSPRTHEPIRSSMGRSTPEQVFVRGKDLSELLGSIDFGGMAWLELTGRLPSAAEAKVFNALLVTLVEHGLTPSAIAARMTYLGAPEAMQAAVAAGLNGMGSVYGGGAESVARLLSAALPAATADGGDADVDDADLGKIARRMAQEKFDAGKPLPGLGHPLHKQGDPRTARLFDIAQANGFRGRYVRLLELTAVEAGRLRGKPLPINATGAIGALCCELRLPWQVARGIAVMGRAVGLVGHIAEEARAPMAREIWLRAEEEAADNAGR